WAMLSDKQWIDTGDRHEMGRGNWTDGSASSLIASFERQRARLETIRDEREAILNKSQQDKNQRSLLALVLGGLGSTLTALGVFGSVTAFGEKTWLALYAFCFVGIPICAGMAGAMFYTLRRAAARPPSTPEALAHGFWAGLGSAILFFVSQVTSNRQIT